MSTPSGKSFNPSDPSLYAPKRGRERSASDEPSIEQDEASATLPPYAAPRRAPLRQAAPVDQAVGASEPSPDEPNQQRRSPGESISDADLQRLESSLRWLQREGSSGRLPRAVQLPPVSGIRPVSADGGPREDKFIDGYRIPPSLAPDRLRSPPLRERRDMLRGPLRVMVASVVAVPIAYYVLFGGFGSFSLTERAPDAVPPQSSCCIASTVLQVPKDPVRPSAVRATAQDGTRSAAQDARHAGDQPDAGQTSVATPPASTAAAVGETEQAASPPVAPGTRMVKTVRELDPEAVKLLMQQGEQFVAAGDLVTARIVFRRAAEAGDATAALAMGATYDPIVLAKLGARSMMADVEKARGWYQKAQAYGSPEAPHRIEMLANR